MAGTSAHAPTLHYIPIEILFGMGSQTEGGVCNCAQCEYVYSEIEVSSSVGICIRLKRHKWPHVVFLLINRLHRVRKL
jgi:hypothetical protein